MHLSQLLENETSQFDRIKKKLKSFNIDVRFIRKKVIDDTTTLIITVDGDKFRKLVEMKSPGYRKPKTLYFRISLNPDFKTPNISELIGKASGDADSCIVSAYSLKFKDLLNVLDADETEKAIKDLRQKSKKMPKKKLTLEDALNEGGPIKVWETPEDFDRWLKKAKPFTIAWRGKMSGLQGFDWDKAYKKLIHETETHWSKSNHLLDAIKDWPVKYDLNEVGNVLKEAQKKAFKVCSDPNNTINRMHDYGFYKVYDFFIKLYGMDIKQSDEKMKEIKDTATKMPTKKLTLRK